MPGEAGSEEAHFQGRADQLFFALFILTLIENIADLEGKVLADIGHFRLTRPFRGDPDTGHQDRFAGGDDIEGLPAFPLLFQGIDDGRSKVAEGGEGLFDIAFGLPVQTSDLERGEAGAVLVEKDFQSGQDVVIDGAFHTLDLHLHGDRRRRKTGQQQEKDRNEEYDSTRQGCYIMKDCIFGQKSGQRMPGNSPASAVFSDITDDILHHWPVFER